MDRYLIPANTKRGKLIFGLFREIDLIIFVTGVVITFILMLSLPMENTTLALVAIAPALICSLLVAPVPYYHNVMTVIIETYQFLTDRQKFIWRGWCFTNGKDEEK